MELHLKIVGVLLVILSAIHMVFPKRFEWKAQLSGLYLINRQLMYVHTFFIGLVVFLMGLLCISSSHEIVSTILGRRIALGLGVFWSCRLFFQFFVYSSELWRGKRFETVIHIFFSFLWTYFSFVYFWVYYSEYHA